MTAKDQLKLLAKGFTILRVSQVNKNRSESWVIKYKSIERHNWSVLQKDIPSEALLNRNLKELLSDPLTVAE